MRWRSTSGRQGRPLKTHEKDGAAIMSSGRKLALLGSLMAVTGFLGALMLRPMGAGTGMMVVLHVIALTGSILAVVGFLMARKNH